jgi:hypothetical protein
MEKQCGMQLLHGKTKPAGAGMKFAQEEHELTGGSNKVRAEKHHSDMEDKLWAGPRLLHGWRTEHEMNKCQQKKIGGMNQSSLYSRENQEKEKKIKMEKNESCVAIPKTNMPLASNT